MQDFTINTFYGQNTIVRDIKALKPGYSPDALNWITSKEQDSIALRRGYKLLGQTRVDGPGRVTGIGKGKKYNGSEVLFFAYGRKVKYYDPDIDDTVEINTDLLPPAADGEDVWMRLYQGLAGSFMYIGSPNSSVYKIPTANPDSAVDQSVNNYRWGVFHVGQSRVFAGQRNGTVAGNNDRTGLYLSYIDKDQLSDFTQVTGESVGTGTGVAITFTGTFAQAGAPKTIMYPSITDTVETFVDDRDGNMIGNLGGTGTINYATGDFSVTFNTAPADTQAITASYYHETATTEGVLDFTGNLNGQGKSFRQDTGGGKIMAMYNINTTVYCFHELKTWQFQSSVDDTESTNLEYRNVGIPYPLAAHQVPDGIIMTDLSNPSEPKYRKMQVLQGTDITTIEPQSISDRLDLSLYGHTKSVAWRWGDYEIFSSQAKQNGVADQYNSVTWIRNTASADKVWDRLNYYVSSLVEYDGMLIAGDSISNNCYVLFSGYDEDGDTIENYWTSSSLSLNTTNQKTCRRMVVDGLIQKEQALEVWLSYDGAEFTKTFTIEGDGSYVDVGSSTYIGGPTLGTKTIGSGGNDEASPYEVDFPINSDRFVDVQIKLIATKVGYVQVNSLTFKDIRDKGRKHIPSRTV
jgi:hypothetical protein